MDDTSKKRQYIRLFKLEILYLSFHCDSSHLQIKILLIGNLCNITYVFIWLGDLKVLMNETAN